MYEDLIKKLENNRIREIKNEKMPGKEDLEFYKNRIGGFTAVMYVPHEENYADMLSKLKPDDVLCDMGAGDLRFALMAIKRCKKVYAVELSPHILSMALKIIKHRLPRQLIVICADWRYFPIPDDVTVISCLVNINEDDIPVNIWKQNNRRVYWGVVGADVKELLIEIKDPGCPDVTICNHCYKKNECPEANIIGGNIGEKNEHMPRV